MATSITRCNKKIFYLYKTITFVKLCKDNTMNREKKIYTLQNIFVMTRDEHMLLVLYKEIQTLAEKIICKKTHNEMPHYLQKEKATDAAFRFLEMYIKHEDWECFNFPVRLGLDVQFILHNRQLQAWDKVEVIPKSFYKEPDQQEDVDFVLNDIKSESENWKEIFIICYRAKSFKSFILELDKIENRQWIYDHVKRLKCLYKYTRRMPSCRRKRFVGIAASLENV